MLLNFTKMHGASNDFIVIDSYSKKIDISTQDIIKLANRHTGVGADQILLVEKSFKPNCDFKYRIFNNDGCEVEHCGNGARCFMRYVNYKNLTPKNQINVEVMKGIISLTLLENGLVEVNMGQPKFLPIDVDFDIKDLNIKVKNQAQLYEIKPNIWISVISMGNPHAVQILDDIDSLSLQIEGKYIESHPRFKNKVNASFMQIIDKHHIKLRVYERGVGETLSCGTGACASVVCGIRMGLLQSPVQVKSRGGNINIIWQGDVIMQGDAHIVFEGQINLQNLN